jgi:hypothetical protein
MKRTTLAFAGVLAICCSATTEVRADETSVHVVFETNEKVSLHEVDNGQWRLKCARSCEVDVPAGFEGLYVTAGDKTVGHVRIPNRPGETVHVRYADRSAEVTLLGVLGGTSIVAGIGVIAYAALRAFGEGYGRAISGCGDPGAMCEPEKRTDQTGLIAGGTALAVGGLAAVIIAVNLPTRVVKVDGESRAIHEKPRRAPLPPLEPDHPSAATPALPRTASFELLKVKV